MLCVFCSEAHTLRTSQYVNTDLRLHTGQDRSPGWKSGCVSSIRPPKAPPYVDFATLFLSSDFLLCSRHHYYDHQGEPSLSWFTCWFTVIWKRSVPPLPFRLVVLRSDGSLADDAPPHVFKPSRSVMMSMLILDVWPPPRTWLDPLAALHLLLPVWHPVHPDWSGTRSWPSNPEETIWGTGNDKCLASSTVRAADVFSLPARRCASRCYARLLCQLVFIPCELALRHSSDYLGTGPGLFLNTPIIFATTIRWSKS